MGVNYAFHTDELKGEYQKAFDQVELYRYVHNMSSEKIDVKLNTLVKTMIQAQHKQDPIESVIGEDLDGFCKTFYGEYSMKDRVFGYATSLYHVSYVLLVLEFIFALLGLGDAEYHFFSSQSNLSAFLLGFIISVITTWGINCYVKQKTFPLKYLTSNRYTVLSLALMAVCVALSLNFIEDDMLCIPTYIELIGAIFYIVAYKAIQLITRKRTYGSFQKPKELKMDPMKVECRNSLKRGFVNGLLDRYERLNKKRLRKGKQPLTREEYMVVLHEDHHKMKVVSVVMLVVFMIALTMLVLFVTRNDPVNEKFIFAGILSLFEAPVIYFFCIRFMIGRDMRTKLFRELDELQIDIFDYNERLNIIE